MNLESVVPPGGKHFNTLHSRRRQPSSGWRRFGCRRTRSSWRRAYRRRRNRKQRAFRRATRSGRCRGRTENEVLLDRTTVALSVAKINSNWMSKMLLQYLRTVGVWTSVGHGEDTRSSVLELEVLVLKIFKDRVIREILPGICFRRSICHQYRCGWWSHRPEKKTSQHR